MLKPGRNILILGLAAVLINITPLGQALYENNDVYDPKSSSRKSGVDVPRDFFTPPTPRFEKIDPEEFADYHKTHYSPYAKILIPRPVQIGETRLNQGFYLVKLDVVNPNSKDVTYHHTTQASVEFQKIKTPMGTVTDIVTDTHQIKQEVPAGKDVSDKPKRKKGQKPDNSDVALTNDQTETPEVSSRKKQLSWTRVEKAPKSQGGYKAKPGNAQQDPPQVRFMIKREGEVLLSIPIQDREALAKETPQGPAAELSIDAENPVDTEVVRIKYCVKKMCYRSAPLQPGLVQ